MSEATLTEAPTTEDQIETIQPKATVRHVTIGKGEFEETYVQKPLSFFGKMQLFSLIGQAGSRASENGAGLGDLLDMDNVTQDPETGRYSITGLNDTAVMMQMLMKIAEFAPDLMLEAYCIFLNVPRGSRGRVKATMELAEQDGGLSDEDGIGILETAIDQNWELMVTFFEQRVKPLIQRMQTRVGASRSSKPSKGTRRRTRKE